MAKKPTKPEADPDLAGFGDLGLEEETAAEAEAPETPETNGEGDGGDLDTSITIDGIKTSIAKSSGGGDRFFRLNDGEKKEIRFLDDLLKGIKVARHEDYQRGLYPTTCYKVYGKECPFCKGEIPLKDWYAWNVLNFTDNKVQVLQSKATKGSITQQLAGYFGANDSITKTNFVVQRTGTSKDTAYTIQAKERSSQSDKEKIAKAIKVSLPKKHNLREALKPDFGAGQEKEDDSPLQLTAD